MAVAKKAVVKKGGARKAPAKKAAPRKRAASTSGTPENLEKCFVISPFGDWFDQYHVEVYVPAIADAGLHPCRADDLFRPSAIVQDIWNYVKSAKVVLADLTGKNPNVLYELGLAHALDKPVVMITQALEDVPFDLRSMRITTYDIADPHWAEALKERISASISEVLEAPATAIFQPFNKPESSSVAPDATADSTMAELKVLERRVNRLQAQLAATPRVQSARPSQSPDIPASEARRLIDRWVDEGLPGSMIYERLENRGVPLDWISEQLRESYGDQGG